MDTYQLKLEKVFKLNDNDLFKFIHSSITLLEVLIKPLRDGETKIVEQYKTILSNAEGIDIFDITSIIAAKVAKIRAKYKSRTPDALQIATAISHKANYFFTDDHRLKNITEIQVILIADLI